MTLSVTLVSLPAAPCKNHHCILSSPWCEGSEDPPLHRGHHSWEQGTSQYGLICFIIWWGKPTVPKGRVGTSSILFIVLISGVETPCQSIVNAQKSLITKEQVMRWDNLSSPHKTKQKLSKQTKTTVFPNSEFPPFVCPCTSTALKDALGPVVTFLWGVHALQYCTTMQTPGIWSLGRHLSGA